MMSAAGVVVGCTSGCDILFHVTIENVRAGLVEIADWIPDFAQLRAKNANAVYECVIGCVGGPCNGFLL